MFMAQCFRLGGGVVHPLIGRYVLRGKNGILYKKIEKALLEYFRSNLERLSDKEIDLIDIGVFPWHSKIEVSFYESGDSASLDDIAAWKLYDFSSMNEGHWNLGLDVAEDLSKEWDKSRDILPFLFDF
ncbi:hypothetical protein [Vibrio parahaemolyticus]|uniref:hypothetical protein n=1 Tax=Vibrio parahaemolyticus TaxID=670 RepID=UPI0015DFA981|nr:hypothetical protein [Vibrio parahaemolyticus]